MKRRFLPIMLTALALMLTVGGTVPAYAASSAMPAEWDITRDLRIGEVGRTFYVSSDGDDGQDGQSEDTAFSSFAPLRDIILTPGDCVLLRRGDTWHERLTVRGSGTKDAWIFVGAYGDADKPAPEISLNNDRDDICLLVSDIISPRWEENGFDYIWIDGLHLSHATLGICFRAAYSEDNVGVRVTNCTFTAIDCPDLMQEALTSTEWLGKPKGHLPTVSGGRVQETGGGAYEYIWPGAITFCGRPTTAMSAAPTADGRARPTNKVTDIELYQNTFRDCIMAVSAHTYSIHYGTGPDSCFTYTKNWRVRGLTSENTVTMFNVDSADFGWDGTDTSEWGIFEHVQALSGKADCSMSMGTTQAMFSVCRNLCIKNSQFNGCRNNGQPDGCGFDFERSDFNFLLKNCVFAENEGQSVLMMQTTMTNQVTGETVTTENGSCTLDGCVFYNNFRNVYNEHYCFDFQMFNEQNQDITLKNCAFYEPTHTSGNATVGIDRGSRRMRAVGPRTEGVTYENNEEHIGNDLPPLADILAARGMTDATLTFSPVAHTRDSFTGPIVPETEPATQPVTEPETEPVTAPATKPEATAAPDTGAGETQNADTTAETAATAPGGCASLMDAVGAVTAIAAAGALHAKKRD